MEHLISYLSLSDHLKWDVLYWVAFAAGQWLFILKRMALAVRSPLNKVRSRRQYLYANWDILLIRSALEFAIVYFPYRHVPMDTFVTALHIPFHIPQNSAVMSFMLGFLSDSTMDWLAMQDKVMGVPIPSWVKETVPQMPEVQTLVSSLTPKV